MTLSPLPAFTSERTYLVKLHRDSDPGRGQLAGRVEHVESGARIDFASSEGLLAAIILHATEARTGSAP